MGLYFNFFVQFLIIFSIVNFSILTLPNLIIRTQEIINGLEIFCVSVFIVEYLFRIYAAKSKVRFFFSFCVLINENLRIDFWLLRKLLLSIIVLLFWIRSIAQTATVISEIRTDFGIENLDLRFRPVIYFISKSRMRREAFLGHTTNKTSKIFGYLRYNDYEKKNYTGF